MDPGESPRCGAGTGVVQVGKLKLIQMGFFCLGYANEIHSDCGGPDGWRESWLLASWLGALA